jgi:hypothetical protein
MWPGHKSPHPLILDNSPGSLLKDANPKIWDRDQGDSPGGQLKTNRRACLAVINAVSDILLQRL